MSKVKPITGKIRSWTRNVQAVILAGLVLALGCSKESIGPEPDENGTVFNSDGGFVITNSMLDKRYNEITFPGTHNSYALGWAEHCNNQNLPIIEQLQYGIRYIEFDIDKDLYVNHNGYCAGYLTPRLLEIKSYVMEHPNQIFTIRISDLSPTTFGESNAPSPAAAYELMNWSLTTHGLDAYIYNWDPTKPNDDSGRCYIPDPWPTLREMIDSGKNLMFLHHHSYGDHGIVDMGYCRGLSYSNEGGAFCDADLQEQLCRLMTYWSPPRPRQVDGPNRLLLLESCPDNHDAGCVISAAKNNDGQRLYQLAKHHEDSLLPDPRVANFITIDYFESSIAGRLPIDIVDACNRLNCERFGIDWRNWGNSEHFWELYPHEFDGSKVEHLSQISVIRAEVFDAADRVINKQSLAGLENSGNIVATVPLNRKDDWIRVPEWAADNDLFTRWAGNNVSNHSWAVDLGERKSIDEIAIAWDFPHRRPGFRVYASNDDNRFADGISNEELATDDGWLLVAQRDKGPYGSFWDTVILDGQGITDWRYIRIKVNDASIDWPVIWEVKLYGPAN